MEIMKFEDNTVEIIVENDEPLFEVYSTGMALGQSVTAKGNIYPNKKRIEQNLISAEIQPVLRNAKLFMTESQLYDLMLEMKTDKVKPFRKWVTTKVLPTIRKTGGYVSNSAQFVDNYFGGIDQQQKILLTTMLEASKKQAETIKVMQPKADYYDKILMSKDAITPTEMGKLFGMSAQKFHKTANSLGLMYKVGKNWVLYKKYQDKGYTKLKTYCDSAGHPHECTCITHTGKKFFVDEFAKIGIIANRGEEE